MTTGIDAIYSIYNRTFKFKVNGIEYDISDKIPESVWNLAKEFFDNYELVPDDIDWEIRKKLRKIFIKYFKENIDKNLRSGDVIF